MWNLSRYESLVYGIQATSPHIQSSSLVLQRQGKLNCWLVGTVQFSNGIRLEVAEPLISFLRPSSVIIVTLFFVTMKSSTGMIPRLILTTPLCNRLILITSTFHLI
jgi:hypothetical protein